MCQRKRLWTSLYLQDRLAQPCSTVGKYRRRLCVRQCYSSLLMLRWPSNLWGGTPLLQRSWAPLLPASLPLAIECLDPLGLWHFAWAMQLDRAVALLLVLNKMLFIKLSWATLLGAASWKTRLQKAARKAVLLHTAAISHIFLHLLSKAERRAPLRDLVWLCTLLLSGDKWCRSWARRAWPCWRVLVLLQLVYPSSCTVIQRRDEDPTSALKPVHGFVITVDNLEESTWAELFS